MQHEDETISRFLLWLPYNPGGDLESFVSNFVTREEAVQHGPEVLAYWSRWNELTVRKSILYRRWYSWHGKSPILQIVVSVVGRKEILDQLYGSPVSGGICCWEDVKENPPTFLVATDETGCWNEACLGTEAPDVAKGIVESWVLRFGVPDLLHTAQGNNFGSELMLEVCKLLKIDKTMTSPYHPKGDGQVQRHNRVIADVILK